MYAHVPSRLINILFVSLSPSPDKLGYLTQRYSYKYVVASLTDQVMTCSEHKNYKLVYKSTSINLSLYLHTFVWEIH